MPSDPLADAVLHLGIVLVGLTLVLGLVRARFAFQVLLALVLVYVFAPFLEPHMPELPSWILLPFVVLLALALLQGFVGVFLGRRAAAAMAGNLAASMIRLAILVLLFPLRAGRLAVRLLSPGGFFR